MSDPVTLVFTALNRSQRNLLNLAHLPSSLSMSDSVTLVFTALNRSHINLLNLADLPSFIGHLINYLSTGIQDLGLNILRYE